MSPQEKGQYLDLSSESQPSARAAEDLAVPSTEDPGKRRFVGVEFECCSIYTRVYINAEGTAYEGKCPRCAKPVQLQVGPGGTSSRFFRAN